MAATAPGLVDGGDAKLARATAKLDAALQTSDYYSALQLYRTLVKRKIDAGALVEAEAMLVEGARTLLRRGKALEGLDLADMMLKSLFTANSVPLTARACASIVDISESVPKGSEAVRATFLRSAVKWANDAAVDTSPVATSASADAGASSASSAATSVKVSGSAAAVTDRQRRHADLVSDLHRTMALACVAAGPEHYADAQRYFIEAHAPAAFAEFLHDWALKGYAREHDLFLARGVLQLLCRGYLGDANGVYERFAELEAKKSVLDSPLSHFVKFLLATLERDARPLFEMLCDKYKAALSRDETFRACLAAIGQRYFAIAPPRSGMDNMMSQMMSQMMGGGGGMPRLPGMGGMGQQQQLPAAGAARGGAGGSKGGAAPRK